MMFQNPTPTPTPIPALGKWLHWGLISVSLAAGGAAAQTSSHRMNFDETVKSSFKDNGIAKVERLNQDNANAECAKAQVAGKPLAANKAKAIEAENLASIKSPNNKDALTNYFGDIKQGEAIAQSGRGLTWTDTDKTVNGGNCYNCHQISKQEISFGTIGPSLYNYGKIRGVTDINHPASKAMIEYTWGKLYNARAYNACSNMPRFGHKGILTEEQMRHLMSLLLDPKSPVNQ